MLIFIVLSSLRDRTLWKSTTQKNLTVYSLCSSLLINRNSGMPRRLKTKTKKSEKQSRETDDVTVPGGTMRSKLPATMTDHFAQKRELIGSLDHDCGRLTLHSTVEHVQNILLHQLSEPRTSWCIDNNYKMLSSFKPHSHVHVVVIASSVATGGDTRGHVPPNPNPARSCEFPRSEEKTFVLGSGWGSCQTNLTKHYGEWSGQKQFVSHQ